ncbi:MAG: nicotinate phosphoribosyltransferase [Gammaproteobacteria bacterium]|nr:MAG: nicotinate phosphoribosyltransferase [Gammaproteobacteria bacterium]
MIDSIRSALLTDLYQLTMLQAYVQHGMEGTAVFEFFVRKLPPQRRFLVAAGVEQVLTFLEGLRFTPEELEWLDATGRFQPAFLDYLSRLRFTGDVHALPEGTVFFADEPVLRVTAPLPQAQLVESRLINLLHLQILVASKAARCVLAGPDKLLVDFGLRRAHGAEAGLLAARAGYLAGLAGTATVAAGLLFGIPVYGTMAHSFVEAHDDELLAFEHFAFANPGSVVLLLATYHTEAAARKVARLAPRLAQQGIQVKGVRIDSGDLAEHARRVRAILDEAGLEDITVFASGGIDEQLIAEHRRQGVPIDGYGVGTLLDTSADAPYLDCAYKLMEYGGRPRRKRSEGKATWPGRKQVWRRRDGEGRLLGDLVALEGEPGEGRPLLHPVMEQGQRLAAPEPLQALRERTLKELEALPPPLRELAPGEGGYPVAISEGIRALARELDQQGH